MEITTSISPRLRGKAVRLLALRDLVATKEAELKEAKRLLQHFAESELPELMDDEDVTRIDIDEARMVVLEQEVHVNLSDARREDAITYLRVHGYADAIKHEVVVTFDAGDDATARAVVEAITTEAFKRRGVEVADRPTVHGSTLKRILREMLGEGKDIPWDLFGTYAPRVARVVARPEVADVAAEGKVTL